MRDPGNEVGRAVGNFLLTKFCFVTLENILAQAIALQSGIRVNKQYNLFGFCS